MAVEKYILTRSMHLGHLKDTFGKGAVITFDDEKRLLNIDGRRFDDVRDMDILKRQAEKRPDDPWIIPYTPEDLAEIRGVPAKTAPAVQRRASNGAGMKIVQDDSSEIEPIDIRSTQVGKRNAEKKAADRQRVKTQDLEIIQGDETVEDRIARLKGAKSTDMSARAERIRLMRERPAQVPIVRDDSLGAGVSGKHMPLNAGMPVGGRRAEDTPAEVKAKAEARRREADARRQRIAEESGLDPEGVEVVGALPEESDAGTGPVEEAAEAAQEAPQAKAPAVDPRDAQIAALMARLDALENKDSKHPVSAKNAKSVKVARKVGAA